MTLELESVAPVREPPSIAPAAIEIFGAAKAAVAFVMLLVSQFLTGLTVIVGWTFVALARGDDATKVGFAERITAESTPLLLVASSVVSSIVVFGIARLWAWRLVKDKTATGLGFTRAPLSKIVVWSVTGAVVAMAYLAAVRWLVPPDPGIVVGPVASAAAGGGMGRLAWVVLALGFAPVMEEFFFRGLLLSGFSATWGPRVSAALVTTLFVALHLFETINYWPACLAVLSLGLLALAARVTSRSLVPAMSLHFSYNLVISLVVFGVLRAA